MIELTCEQLCRGCDPSQFDFETTDELEELDAIVGQERAVEAIQFGIEIAQEGFNLFAIGPSGVGKHHVVTQFLYGRAPEQPTPDDWLYVHNFADPRRPRAIRLAAGRAHEVRRQTDEMVVELETAVPACLEHEDFRAQRRAIHHEFDRRHEGALRAVDEEAQTRGLALQRTADGFAFVEDEEEGAEPTEEEREALDAAREEMSATLREVLDDFPGWEQERREALREQERAALAAAVAPIFTEMRKEFADSPALVSHLGDVEIDIISDPSAFLPHEHAEQPRSPFERATTLDGVERYSVNVVVDHAETVGAPIVYEDDPSVDNLIGRIEHETHFGSLTTNYGLIRPGALHAANGGYLIVDARKLLADPPAWELLKRALYAHHIRVDSARDLGMQINALTLVPDPIPLDVKVVMVGERRTYYALREFDPDIEELFKVMVDFDTEMVRSPDATETYARLIATLARGNSLRPLTAAAVARVIEHSSRMANDSSKLTTHMRTIADLLREANYWATGDAIDAGDVQTAIDKQERRNGRLRDQIGDQITEGTIVIPTSGEAVGRLNGLSVLTFGQSSFGRPSRISATVAVGRGEVFDIEREVDLGGPIHSKGVMILRGFLTSRYATEAPLSLTASIVFEQSYGGVDGDSASLAETCAILSAISQIPLTQSIAVTGAIDQYGHVRAVGGVNEKIEGFFRLCADRGLDGSHGVIIPSSNVPHLMLRAEIVDAVKAGDFHVWAADHVEGALELLTGVPADEVGAAVRTRLIEFATMAKQYRVND